MPTDDRDIGTEQPEPTHKPEDMEDWELVERIRVRPFGRAGSKWVGELLDRFEPHVDWSEKPSPVDVWCLDCEWEKTVEITWMTDDPVTQAKRSAAAHIGNSDGCQEYDYGRAFTEERA